MIPDDIEIGISVGCHECIRCLHGIVGIAEFATGTVHVGRQSHIHSFHGIVDQVHAPVGHQPTGIIPEEAEVIVKAVLIEIALGCRTEPHIVIHSCGDSRVGYNRQCPLAGLVGPHFYGAYPSQCSTLHIGCSLIPVWIAALPLPYLYDPVVLAGGFYHEVALLDGVGQRFLDVDILACFTGGYKLQAVPMIGRADDDHVYIFVIDNSAPVFYQLCRFISF